MKWSLLTLAVLLPLSSQLWAADDCATTIEGNDAMQFNLNRIAVPASCDEFTVELKHTGKLDRSVMGHNWVLTEKADKDAVVESAVKAGLDEGYLDESDDRVIAATKLLGGGETDSVTFDTSQLQNDKPYEYFCSFPGHESVMRGTLIVE